MLTQKGKGCITITPRRILCANPARRTESGSGGGPPAARCAQSVPSAVIGFGVRHRTSARAVGETASVLSFDAPNGCAQLTADTPTL
jgi:hypothetical protein